MVKNTYFLAKIGADTAEHERSFGVKNAKNLQLREVQHAVADAVEQRRQTSAGDTGDTPVFRSSCAGCE